MCLSDKSNFRIRDRRRQVGKRREERRWRDYAHPCMHMYMDTHMCTQTCTYTHMCTHTIHTYAGMHKHTCSCTHPCTYTETHIHLPYIHTATHTGAHTNTYIYTHMHNLERLVSEYCAKLNNAIKRVA